MIGDPKEKSTTPVAETALDFESPDAPPPLYLKLEPVPYQAPEAFAHPLPGSTPQDLMKQYVESLGRDLTPQGARQVAKYYFSSLGLHAGNWQDFTSGFCASRPDLLRATLDTALKVADVLAATPKALTDDDGKLAAARFLVPSIQVEFNGAPYGINVGTLYLAARSPNSRSWNYATRSWANSDGEEIRLHLQASLDSSLDTLRPLAQRRTSTFHQDDLVFYDVAPTSYRLHADAGHARSLAEIAPEHPGSSALDGSASFATDGGQLLYQWRQIGGPAVTWESARNLANPLFRPAKVVTDGVPVTFELTVTNDRGVSDTATVVHTINDTIDEAPTLAVTAPKEVLEGDPFAIVATARDENPNDHLRILLRQKQQNSLPGIAFPPLLTVHNNGDYEYASVAPIVGKAYWLEYEIIADDGRGGLTTQPVQIRVLPQKAINVTKDQKQFQNDLAYVAEKTGGKYVQVGTERKAADPLDSLLQGLVIDSPQPDAYIPPIVIDGSASMVPVAAELAARADQVVGKILEQIPENGTFQTGLFLYRDGQTYPLFWMAKPVKKSDTVAINKAIADLQKAAEEAGKRIKEPSAGYETLWHTMGELLEGDLRLPFTDDPKRVQRIIAFTDDELWSKENEHPLNDSQTWTAADALAMASRHHVEFYPIQFVTIQKTTDDFIADLNSPVEQTRLVAAGQLAYKNEPKVVTALLAFIAREQIDQTEGPDARDRGVGALAHLRVPGLLNEYRDLVKRAKKADGNIDIATTYSIEALGYFKDEDARQILKDFAARNGNPTAIEALASIGHPDDFDTLLKFEPTALDWAKAKAGFSSTALQKYQFMKQKHQFMKLMCLYGASRGDRRAWPYVEEALLPNDSSLNLQAFQALAKMAQPGDEAALNELLSQSDMEKEKADCLKAILEDIALPPERRKTDAQWEKFLQAKLLYTD